jgi:hypothetical protein
VSKQETMTAAEYRAEQARPKRMKASEAAHRLFASQIRARGLPEPRWKFGPGGELAFAKGVDGVTRFKPGKTDRAPQWRFDFAWPAHMIAVEYQGVNVRMVDGQMRTSGGHADVQHLRKQHEKHAWATVLGWRVLYFERDMVHKGYAVDMLVRLFAALPLSPLGYQWTETELDTIHARDHLERLVQASDLVHRGPIPATELARRKLNQTMQYDPRAGALPDQLRERVVMSGPASIEILEKLRTCGATDELDFAPEKVER